MLMPKRTKYRRVQRGRMKGAASRGNKTVRTIRDGVTAHCLTGKSAAMNATVLNSLRH